MPTNDNVYQQNQQNVGANNNNTMDTNTIIPFDTINVRNQQTNNNNTVTVAHNDLPTYDEAVDQTNNSNNTAPPSYDSLYGKMREARKRSTNFLDFAKNVFILLLGTIGCGIILGVNIVIPISMIVFGSIYLHQCPQGEYIPVYLLVGGLMGVIKPILHLATRVRSREDQAQEQLRQSGNQSLINWFMLGWFLIGSYWIYREYEPNYDPKYGLYCNRTLYAFAFWLITSVYILVGIVTVCLLIISILSLIFQRTPDITV